MNLKYFGTDGVRGVFGEDLTIELIEKIATAIKASGCKKVMIGRDTRESGTVIADTMKKVFWGIAVIDIGIVPTNAVAFLVCEYKCDFGIMITASHNPPEHNGIKVFNAKGRKIDGKELEKLDALIDDSITSIRPHPVSQWTDFLVKKFAPNFKDKNLPTITMDFANGSGTDVAIDVLRRLGFKITAYNNQKDGKMINLNCGAMHPEFLQKAMKKSRATVGFAFDGDADRCIVADENGSIIDGDKLIAAFGIYLGVDDVVSTVMFNGGTEKYLLEKGINVHRTPVGERHVIAQLRKIPNKCMGGEPNGHFIFPDIMPCDDALISVLMVLKIIVETGKNIREICTDIPLWYSLLHNTRKDIPVGEFTLDGCRVLIRKSGTENLTRVYVEGESQAKVKAIAKSYM